MNNYVTMSPYVNQLRLIKPSKTMIVDLFFLFVNKSLIYLWIFGMMQFDNAMLLLVCGTMLPSKSILVLYMSYFWSALCVCCNVQIRNLVYETLTSDYFSYRKILSSYRIHSCIHSYGPWFMTHLLNSLSTLSLPLPDWLT